MGMEVDVELEPGLCDLRGLEEELFAQVAFGLMDRKAVGVLIHTSSPEQLERLVRVTIAVMPWHRGRFHRARPMIEKEIRRLVFDEVRVEVARMPFHCVLMLLAIRFLRRTAPPEPQTA